MANLKTKAGIFLLVGAGRQKQQKYPGFLAWGNFFLSYPLFWAFIHRYFEGYPQIF